MATGGEVGGKICVGSEDISELKCQPCHEDGEVREAVGMCIDCQDYLCRSCFDGHKKPKPCRNHQLLDKQQLVQSDVTVVRKDKSTKKCSLHDDKTIKYHCIEHGLLGCSICLNLDHRTCKPVQYIPHAATYLDNNEEFKQVENSLNSATTLCKQVSDFGDEIVQLIQDSCAEAIANLESHRRNINIALDKIQTDIVQTAETMKLKVVEKTTSITDKYRRAKTELREIQTRAEQLQKANQNCDLYIEMMTKKDKLRNLESELKDAEKALSLQENKIQFTPNLELLEMLDNKDILRKLNEKEGGAFVKAEHDCDINIITNTDKMNCRPTGSTFLSDNELVIADQTNHRIKVIDVSKKRVLAQTKLSSEPWDICKITTNQVAVSHLTEMKISILKVNRRNVNVVRTLNVDGKCGGIDFKDGKLAVSLPHPHKVQVLDLQGTVLHTIMTDPQGSPLFSSLLYLIFGRDGNYLYVSNLDSNNIVCVKLDGTILATYTDNQLKYSTGVVADSHGNVYGCGFGSNNVHQISPDCRKLRVLLGQTDGVESPGSISYSAKDDKLYVGMLNDSNKIAVYKVVRGSV